MPIYEYECLECGHRFEQVVLPASTPACPACQGQHLKRLLSLFSVSSEATKASHLSAARQKNAKVNRDKQVAEHEAFHHHDDE